MGRLSNRGLCTCRSALGEDYSQHEGGRLEVAIATALWPEPEWPEQTFEELFHLAFRGQVIDSIDHPVIRQLKGAA